MRWKQPVFPTFLFNSFFRRGCQLPRLFDLKSGKFPFQKHFPIYEGPTRQPNLLTDTSCTIYKRTKGSFSDFFAVIPVFIYLLFSSSFPSAPEKKKKWLLNLHRKDWTPSKYSKICSDHFKEVFVNRTGRRVKLKDDAIPTRFKKFPKHLKKVTNYLPRGD